MQPLVSIITPVYRGAATLTRAVNSVLAQDYPHWEMCVISDDGRDYKELLGRQGVCDTRLKFYSTGGISTGPARARNTALAQAGGDFIVNLDSDDAFAPDRLLRMLPLVQKYGAAVSDITMINRLNDRKMENLSCKPEGDFLLPPWTPYACVHTCNAVFYDRARVCPRYAEDLSCMEDFVFLMQLHEASGRIGYLDAPLYVYYKRAGSLTTAGTAAEDFIRACNLILEKIAAGALVFKNAEIRDAAVSFLFFLLRAEDRFIKERQENPAVLFDDVLKTALLSEATSPAASPLPAVAGKDRT